MVRGCSSHSKIKGQHQRGVVLRNQKSDPILASVGRLARKCWVSERVCRRRISSIDIETRCRIRVATGNGYVSKNRGVLNPNPVWTYNVMRYLVLAATPSVPGAGAGAVTDSPKAKRKSPEKISLCIFKNQIPRKLLGVKPFLMSCEDVGNVEYQGQYLNIYT